MIKILKGNIVIGDPVLIGLNNLNDSLILPIGAEQGEGSIHWAPDSVSDLKFYKRSLADGPVLDQELGDYYVDCGCLCIGLWKRKKDPEKKGLVYLTNYEGPVELWRDKNDILHALGYGNIRFYSQWKSI